MSQYAAKIYLDDMPEYTIFMEQERPCMGPDFIRNVELCMDTMPAGPDRVKAVISRNGEEFACMVRRYFQDGSQIRTIFRLRNGWPEGMCGRYINRLQ